jgi:hypothetical protein
LFSCSPVEKSRQASNDLMRVHSDTPDKLADLPVSGPQSICRVAVDWAVALAAATRE